MEKKTAANWHLNNKILDNIISCNFKLNHVLRIAVASQVLLMASVLLAISDVNSVLTACIFVFFGVK